jgi:Fe-S-cluster containining protein
MAASKDTNMDEPFYSSGLLFSCTKCSGCCRGEPGYVFLSKSDIDTLAKFHKMEYEEFIAHYCVTVDLGFALHYSLREKKNGDCTLWDGGCTAYEARPVQCKSYPFWARIVESDEVWRTESEHCPGIGMGSMHSKEEIESSLLAREENPPLLIGRGHNESII